MFQKKLNQHNSTTHNKYSLAVTNYNRSRLSSTNESQDDSGDSYSLFKSNSRNVKLARPSRKSTNSNSTDESVKAVHNGATCAKEMQTIEGIESEYNYLISQNDYQSSGHFSIVNENIRKLINKTRNKKFTEETVLLDKQCFDNNLCEEVSVHDLTHILKNSSPSFNPTLKITNLRHNGENGRYSEKLSSSDQSTPKDVCEEHYLPANIIPEKFRAKKLPHLDKKIRTGYVKFFDDKNNFGFMNLTCEPFGEVFVFGREFEKANISPSVVSSASNNAEVMFKFRVMYYMGKHGESKKAVNIRISNC